MRQPTTPFLDLVWVLLVVVAVTQVLIALWVHRGRPKDLQRKYPRAFWFECSMPFSARWKNRADRTDWVRLEAWRSRLRIGWVLILLPMVALFLSLGLYVNYFDPRLGTARMLQERYGSSGVAPPAETRP